MNIRKLNIRKDTLVRGLHLVEEKGIVNAPGM